MFAQFHAIQPFSPTISMGTTVSFVVGHSELYRRSFQSPSHILFCTVQQVQQAGGFLQLYNCFSHFLQMVNSFGLSIKTYQKSVVACALGI